MFGIRRGVPSFTFFLFPNIIGVFFVCTKQKQPNFKLLLFLPGLPTLVRDRPGIESRDMLSSSMCGQPPTLFFENHLHNYTNSSILRPEKTDNRRQDGYRDDNYPCQQTHFQFFARKPEIEYPDERPEETDKGNELAKHILDELKKMSNHFLHS